MTHTVNRAGNDQDVYNSLKCGWERLKLKDLEAALKDEQERGKRKTVMNHLNRAIRNKKAGKLKF